MGLNNVHPGDRFPRDARTLNELFAATRAWRNQQFDQHVTPKPAGPTGNIRVRNDTDGDRQSFDVVGLAGPVFGPDDNLNEFQRHVTMRVISPDAAAAATCRIAVLAEPLAAGKIGRAYIYGTCVARVKILDPTHASAVPVAGVTDHLDSAAEGPIQVLWNEPAETGAVAWALIRFGGGGGGAQIQFARIMNFWVEDYTAIGYLGYLIPAIRAVVAPEPPPEEWIQIGVWAYPSITYMRDLYYAVPGIPFDTPGLSDVPVIWTPDASVPEEDGGGRYMLLWELDLVCINM